MPDHGSRGRVLDFGVRNHADGFAGRAAEQFGDGFLLGIVQRVGGTVRVDAEGVHAGLVPGHVGGAVLAESAAMESTLHVPSMAV